MNRFENFKTCSLNLELTQELLIKSFIILFLSFDKKFEKK